MPHFLRWSLCAAALMAMPGAAIEEDPQQNGGDVCALASSGYLDGMRWPDFSANQPAVREFYARQNCGLAWTRAGIATDQALATIQLFENADSKGLDPGDYDGRRWAGRLANMGGAGEASPEDVARFDVALTVAALRYVSDLHFGRFNGGLLHSSADREPDKGSLAKVVREMSQAADVEATVEAIEPRFPQYRRTEEALASYIALLQEGEDPELPVVTAPVEPGGSYPATAQLAHRLRRLGDLPPGSEVADDVPAYDSEIVEAVKHFQARHGIDPDGRLTQATLAQLNVPLRKRVRQLEFTLERWRWAPHNLRRPTIVINIPEFQLSALNDRLEADLMMKVVVGNAHGHQTPVFAAEMRSVIFHPYWEVPQSIERSELLPKIEKDRNYLAQHRFEVVNADGNAEMPEAVGDGTLARIRSGALRIRQMPGEKNALGPVKFLFPNQYHVYLHGTPATELFAKTRRDFSHGCIRAEKPEELAVWVLRRNPEWTPGRIHDAMTGSDTIEVALAEPILVLIIYATAMVSETGEALFFPDIYGEDAQLEALSAEGYPYPKWRPQEMPSDDDQ